MSVTDLTADMLTVIRNGNRAKKESVELKGSKLLESVCEILKRESFITNFKTIENKKQGLIKVYLKYNKDGSPAIVGLKTISRSGLRIYSKSSELKKVFGGIGISILTTSQGLMTGQEARAKKIGGEVICYAW